MIIILSVFKNILTPNGTENVIEHFTININVKCMYWKQSKSLHRGVVYSVKYRGVYDLESRPTAVYYTAAARIILRGL